MPSRPACIPFVFKEIQYTKSAFLASQNDESANLLAAAAWTFVENLLASIAVYSSGIQFINILFSGPMSGNEIAIRYIDNSKGIEAMVGRQH